MVVSDHSLSRKYDDVILVGITSQLNEGGNKTELLIEENAPYFEQTGLVKTSLLRGEYLMTIPAKMIARKLGRFNNYLMDEVDNCIKYSLGLH